jgi:gluconate 5-dehydrogenase
LAEIRLGEGVVFSVKDKVVIVTGGYGHLGQAICCGLAENNAIVYLTGKRILSLESISNKYTKGSIPNIKYKLLDISDVNSIEKAFREIMETEGKIDVLINNAVYSKTGNLLNLSESEWQVGLDGTIGGVYRTTKAVIPFMGANLGGSIVNIASMYGVVSPDPSIYPDENLSSPPSYAAGKAAIIQFTRYAACHLGSKNIRVNSISPGPFPNMKTQSNKEFIEKLKNKTPLGRIGNPEDLKGIAVFLSSDEASYITGQNICIDGGWTAW